MPRMFLGREYSDHELVDLGRRIEVMMASQEFLLLKELMKESIVHDLLFNKRVEVSEENAGRLHSQAVAFREFFQHAPMVVQKLATSAKSNLRRESEDGSDGPV